MHGTHPFRPTLNPGASPMLIFNIVVSSQGLPGAQGDLPPVQSLYPDTRVAWILVVGTTWTTGSEPSRSRAPRLSLCV